MSPSDPRAEGLTESRQAPCPHTWVHHAGERGWECYDCGHPLRPINNGPARFPTWVTDAGLAALASPTEGGDRADPR